MKTLSDSEDVTARHTRKCMKTDRFNRVLVGRDNARKDCSSTLYIKDVTNMVRNQVEFCGNVDVMFGPEMEDTSSRVASPIMNATYV